MSDCPLRNNSTPVSSVRNPLLHCSLKLKFTRPALEHSWCCDSRLLECMLKFSESRRDVPDPSCRLVPDSTASQHVPCCVHSQRTALLVPCNTLWDERCGPHSVSWCRCRRVVKKPCSVTSCHQSAPISRCSPRPYPCLVIMTACCCSSFQLTTPLHRLSGR